MTPFEVRLWALETILAFVVASQHMQSLDPEESLERLRTLVLLGDWPLIELPEEVREAALAELVRVAERIQTIQAELPRRLVD